MAEEKKQEEVQEELFKGGKLHGLFSVISNKTVRQNEKFYKKFKGHKSVPGSMVKTNRGYFIDGYNVDQKSTNLWFDLVRNSRKK